MLPSALAADFDPPISLPSVTKEVRTFGNHQVTLRGSLTLELQLCGFRTRHPFYFIDAATPAIGGYDLMQAARLVVDVANKRVWSRRPESATRGPISPNPKFPVYNNSVHSGVAITEPHHAHRVVMMPRPTARSISETTGMSTSRKRRRTASGDSLAPLSEPTEPNLLFIIIIIISLIKQIDKMQSYIT